MTRTNIKISTPTHLKLISVKGQLSAHRGMVYTMDDIINAGLQALVREYPVISVLDDADTDVPASEPELELA